jgi:hypothetical protein
MDCQSVNNLFVWLGFMLHWHSIGHNYLLVEEDLRCPNEILRSIFYLIVSAT